MGLDHDVDRARFCRLVGDGDMCFIGEHVLQFHSEFLTVRRTRLGRRPGRHTADEERALNRCHCRIKDDIPVECKAVAEINFNGGGSNRLLMSRLETVRIEKSFVL